MLNLYTNEHKNGFVGLVGENAKSVTLGLKNDNGKIISGFEVISLLVLFAIANGSQYQTNLEQQRYAHNASHTAGI